MYISGIPPPPSPAMPLELRIAYTEVRRAKAAQKSQRAAFVAVCLHITTNMYPACIYWVCPAPCPLSLAMPLELRIAYTEAKRAKAAREAQRAAIAAVRVYTTSYVCTYVDVYIVRHMYVSGMYPPPVCQ